MAEPKPQDILPGAAAALPVQPSWKPLLWLVGGVLAAVLLWELLFDAMLELGEFLFLTLVEGPEEVLEDYIEEWLKEYHPHQADYYSEMITAIGLTPVKILTGLLLLRWLWKRPRHRFMAFLRRQSLAVWLAWKALPWYYRLASVLALVIVAIIL